MIFLAVFEYAILAITFTISKVAVSTADPLFLIGIRMVASAPIMFLIHYVSQKKFDTIKKEDYYLFFKASIVHVFLPFVGEFWALQYISSAKTAITYSLTPFVAAVLSYFLLKRTLTIKQVVGLIIGFLGLLFIIISKDEIAHVAGEIFHVSLPEIVLLTAVISSSYAWFIITRLMKKGYDITFINGIVMFIGGIMSLIAWGIFGNVYSPIVTNISSFLFWTMLLVIVANVISYNFYGWLLKHLSINFMSAIGFVCPIFASIYGALLLNERLTKSHLIALTLVVCGLLLFYKDEMSNKVKNGNS